MRRFKIEPAFVFYEENAATKLPLSDALKVEKRCLTRTDLCTILQEILLFFILCATTT
jgi:hypothetical protein